MDRSSSSSSSSRRASLILFPPYTQPPNLMGYSCTLRSLSPDRRGASLLSRRRRRLYIECVYIYMYIYVSRQRPDFVYLACGCLCSSFSRPLLHHHYYYHLLLSFWKRKYLASLSLSLFRILEFESRPERERTSPRRNVKTHYRDLVFIIRTRHLKRMMTVSTPKKKEIPTVASFNRLRLRRQSQSKTTTRQEWRKRVFLTRRLV